MTAPTAVLPTDAFSRKSRLAVFFRRFWWLVLIGAALLALAVATVSHAVYYAKRALPGTTVGNIDASGMTEEQIVRALSDAQKAVRVEVDGHATVSFTLADVGVTVDGPATARAALEPSRDVWNRFAALWAEPRVVPVVVSVNDVAAAASAQSLVPADRRMPVDASIKVGADGAVEVVPGRTAYKVDPAVLTEAGRLAARSLTSVDVDLRFAEVAPKVTDAQAATAAEQANKLFATELGVVGTEGNVLPDRATRAAWLKVSLDGAGKPVLAVNREAVVAWVAQQAQPFEWAAKDGKRTVTQSGTVVSVEVEAVDGSKVTNAQAVVDALVSALQKGEPVMAEFETEAVEAAYQDTVVAPAAGSASLAYRAAPGEKWIDVNLSNHTVTAYEGATPVYGPVWMVDGADVTPTVTGTFRVWGKYASQTMRGENYDGTPYVTENVPWILYFYSGYALHGAYWRDSFGYAGADGSHGCVNMPVGDAKWFYDWASVGTVVASHY
ncbi:L,D-transpeptidase family protein [Buchananella felis]|uniref:L,D-transpeptidase family protein n=1 Tax=Buchananella felis TaxID=3231492 RepID=UPI0035272E0E